MKGLCDTNVCRAPLSCNEVKRVGATTDGTYTIDPDGPGALPSRSVHCDLTSDAMVGWTLVASIGNRFPKAVAPAAFFTADLLQGATAWQALPAATVLTPATRGILKVDTWSAPSAIKYTIVETATSTIKNQITFTDPAAITHLRQYATARNLRAGSAVGSSVPFAMNMTFYSASDHAATWWYSGGIFGRVQNPANVGWQFGVSVNAADATAGYDGVHDDLGRAEKNFGVGGYAGTEHWDISSYWAGKCTASCEESWAPSVGVDAAVVRVWHK